MLIALVKIYIGGYLTMDNDVGDDIIILGDDGKRRLIFRGNKVYKVINDKMVLWDIEKDKPMEVTRDEVIIIREQS